MKFNPSYGTVRDQPNGCDVASTAPVRAGNLTLTAYPPQHRLEATRDGRPVWNFVAGARIGQPPVVHKGGAYFASHDGYVYAVNVAGGTTFSFKFLTAGDAATPKAEGSKVVVGGQTVSFKDGIIVLDKTAGPWQGPTPAALEAVKDYRK